MQYKFYIGQDIVAIKDHSQGRFKEGDIHIVKALREGFCNCVSLLIDIGVMDNISINRCTKCRTTISDNKNTTWFGANYFKPLDELTNIDELKEVLNKPIFK
jgi:hypothetical protein